MKKAVKSDTSKPKESRGRKRDTSLDKEILEAAVEILSTVGYEKMTLMMVAKKVKAGKGAMYRRWPTKAALILEAIQHLKSKEASVDLLPDTGTLRGDILALFKPKSVKDFNKSFKIMSGLVEMIAQHPELAEAGHRAMIEPWIRINRILMKRAFERGEIKTDAGIESASEVIPFAIAYRTIVLQQSLDTAAFTKLLDHVVLPALGTR